MFLWEQLCFLPSVEDPGCGEGPWAGNIVNCSHIYDLGFCFFVLFRFEN